MRFSGALLRRAGSEGQPALLDVVAAAAWAENLPCSLVDERQHRREEILAARGRTIAETGGSSFMPEPRYRALRILRRPPGGEVTRLLCRCSANGQHGAHARRAPLARFSNPLRTVAIVDGSLPGLCILAVTSLLSPWITDIRSIYPAYFCGGDPRCGSQKRRWSIGYGRSMCTGNLSEASEESFGGRAGRGPA